MRKRNPVTVNVVESITLPTQEVAAASGGLTDAQLRATPVPVSGTVTASGPLTDAQLRATPVPVSGTVALGASSSNIGDVDVLSLPALPAGTNNIGDVDVLSLPSIPAGVNNIGDVDVLTLPAIPSGTNQIGGVVIENGFRSTENIYSAVIIASAAGASKNHLSIFNADTALKVDILQVYVTKEATAAVTGIIRGHRLFRFTTVHSAGTTPTVRKLDTAMTDLDADITVRAASTLSGAETEPLAAVGIGEEETATTAGRQSLFDHRETNRPITLNQNQGVTVQQDSTAGTGLVSVGILFRVR